MFKYLFIFCFSYVGFAQNAQLDIDEKTKNSKSETVKVNANLLDLNKIDNFSALSILDSAILKNQVFFWFQATYFCLFQQ